MSAFLSAALAYPTVVFTVLLGFFLLYSLATVLGAADIEWLDGALGVDDVNDSVLEGALSMLGVASIPITIVAGVATIFAWLTSFFADRFLPDAVLVDSGILLGAAAIGIGAGSIAVRPFRGFFQVVAGPHRTQLVGKICEIRSLRVDDHSGTAEIGGNIAQVRCFRENMLTIGSKAIVYDYDPNEGLYHVGPIDASIAEVDAVLAPRPQAES
jgi:hypothetical protein